MLFRSNIQAPPPPTSCPLSESPVTSLSSVPITCQQHLAADHRLVFGFWALLLHWWIPPYSFAGSCPSYCPLGCTRPPLWISPSPHTLPRICFQSSDCPSSPEPFHSQFCPRLQESPQCPGIYTLPGHPSPGTDPRRDERRFFGASQLAQC